MRFVGLGWDGEQRSRSKLEALENVLTGGDEVKVVLFANISPGLVIVSRADHAVRNRLEKAGISHGVYSLGYYTNSDEFRECVMAALWRTKQRQVNHAPVQKQPDVPPVQTLKNETEKPEDTADTQESGAFFAPTGVWAVVLLSQVCMFLLGYILGINQ